jgi:hypothetical protein
MHNEQDIESLSLWYKLYHDAFVFLTSNGSTQVGSIQYIGMNGLICDYLGAEMPEKETGELAVFSTSDNLYIDKVHYIIVSDTRRYKCHVCPITMRRCCLQFKKLTPSQLAKLEYFIQHHTTNSLPKSSCCSSHASCWGA